MTIGIVAWAPAENALGAAVASSRFAAMASAIAARPGSGIAASLGILNPHLASAALDHIRGGATPEKAVEEALRGDPARAHRQLFTIDARGRTAAFSGRECLPVFGHTRGTDHVAGGELMESADAVGAMSLSFERSGGDPLSERLLLALESGVRAGADLRGTRSALLVVFRTEEYPLVDLRVDDHAEPVVELRRLLSLWNDRGAR